MRAWIWGVVVLAAACGPETARPPAPAVDVTPPHRSAAPAPAAPALAVGVIEVPGLLPSVLQLPEGPSAPDPNARFIQVSAAETGACGVMSDRTLWCWTGSAPALTQIGRAADWRTVAHGEWHSCAIKLDGTLWCWGWNDLGQLGTGTAGHDPVLVPRQAGEAASWKSVAVDSNSTCGVRTDGTLWCWGVLIPVPSNGEPPTVAAPALINSDGHWRSVSFENGELFAIHDDGRAERWTPLYGSGAYDVVHRELPFTWRDYVATYGIRSDGTLWNGTTDWNCASAETDWASVHAGGLLLRTDGSLWSLDLPSGAVVPAGAERWLALGVGSAYACGVRSDGATWCWHEPSAATQVHP